MVTDDCLTRSIHEKERISMDTIILEASKVKIINNALNAYIRFVLDHRISKENIVHVLAAGRIRKRLQIDPSGQECFEDIELGSNEVEDLKKAFAAFIASAQDIFCSRQKDVISELSTVIESLSTV